MKQILSLGAGVQSSALALMAATGWTTERLDAAVFADTQAEPTSVYKWLDWLEAEIARSPHPYPVHRVTKGSLTKVALTLRQHSDGVNRWSKSVIPCYTLEPDGTKGHMRRTCTHDWKVQQLIKAQRQIAGIKRGQKEVGVISWIGISVDEASRMKPSRVPWVEHIWPLVDSRMTRQDCLNWMRDRGYPQPPRSACVYCPYHSDNEWVRLKEEEPHEFERAVQFERDLQRVKAQTTNMRGVPYLHSARVPLDQVVFKGGERERAINEECTGMCGV